MKIAEVSLFEEGGLWSLLAEKGNASGMLDWRGIWEWFWYSKCEASEAIKVKDIYLGFGKYSSEI